MMTHLMIGLIKKEIVWMSEYFPKPRPLRENVKAELDLKQKQI